jgi:hypothetical protein
VYILFFHRSADGFDLGEHFRVSSVHRGLKVSGVRVFLEHR